MRKRIFVGALALAVCAGTVGVAFAAVDNNTQTADMDVAPGKLPFKRFAAVKRLHVITTSADEDNPYSNPDRSSTNNGDESGEAPAPATFARVDFDDDVLFTIKSVPMSQRNKKNSLGRCPLSQIQSDSTTAARMPFAQGGCKEAMIGKGMAAGLIPGDPATPACTGTEPDMRCVPITAFVGPPQGKKPVIFLHTFSLGAFTNILTGVLGGSPLGGDYGRRLNVTVPELTADSALTEFDVNIQRGYTRKGAKLKVIRARCHDKNRRLNIRGSFDYQSTSGTADTAPTETAFGFQKCKRA
jgi:hypothetical protein